VRITVRYKTYLGIVISAQDVQQSKLHLRKSQNFSLKPIESVFSKEPLISKTQLSLAAWMSEYYAYSLGMLLKSFLPRIHNSLQKCPKDISAIHHHPPHGRMSAGILSAIDKDRMSYIHTLVKQRISADKQILILVSNVYALDHLSQIFTSHYTPEEISVITSSLSTRAFRTEWEHIQNGTRSLIISTRAGIFLPFRNLHTIIIENETSGAYYSFDMYPRYHTVDVAYQLARIHKSFLVFSDLLPSLKSLAYLQQHNVSPPAFPSLPTEHIYRANLSNERGMHTSPIISQYFEQEIQTHASSTPVLILSNRRGNSPFIICKACGFRFTCSHCDSLLVEHTLHIDRHTIKNIFVCHKCTQKFQPKSACPECNSTDIRYAGAGTEKLANYIHNAHPHLSVGILDTDYTPHYKDQLDLFRRWQNGEVQVLIATQMAEKFFTVPLNNTPISLIRESDMMLRFPQYNAKESGILLFSRIITQSIRTYLQHWNTTIPEEEQSSPLDQLQAGRLNALYENEQNERRQFRYPPYTELVAIHSTHRNKAHAWDQARRTKRVLKDISVSTLGPIEHIHNGGRFQVSLLLRLNPDESSLLKRRLLGLMERGQQIDINPEDVL